MDLKKIATIFGILLLGVGILGFVPPLNPDNLLLGIFRIDTLHNLVHITTGALALLLGMRSEENAKRYFQVFGIIYGLVTVMGLMTGHALMPGVIPVNTADNLLHIGITALSLYLGFFASRSAALA